MIMPETTILVVEDEKDILDLVSFNLRQAGFRVIQAREGLEGLRLAQTHGPGLIVLDLMLPGLDGKEICRRLRQGENTRNIPVVMLTGVGHELNKKLSWEIGAEGISPSRLSYKTLLV